MVGLYLIHLLVEARLAEFHSEVELLKSADRASPFIAFPLTLETFLMEGSYNKAGFKISAERTGVLYEYSGRAHSAAAASRSVLLFQILAARGSTPSALYSNFMARLTDTVRDDIADCAAASYAMLSLTAAQSMFKFESMRELAAYLQSRRVSEG